MNRRMEDRIRTLCAEVTTESNPDRVRELTQELRTELHRFIADLRARVSAYPVVAERRAETGVPPPNSALESASETTSPGLSQGAAAKALVR